MSARNRNLMISVAIGLFCGACAKFFNGQSYVVSITLSLAVGLLWDIRMEIRDCQDLQEETRKRLMGMLELLPGAILKDVIGLANHVELHVPKDKIPDAWGKLLRKVETEYVATNYIADLYGEGWVKEPMKTQATIASKIRKVYIVKNDTELNAEIWAFREQEASGMNVKYIFESAIDADPVLAAKRAAVGELDFGVFDRRQVLMWKLDAQRKVDSCRVLLDPVKADEFAQFFDVLFAHPEARRLPKVSGSPSGVI